MQAFECKQGSITQCQCNAIRLSEEAAQMIRLNYNDCLCIKCLTELNKLSLQ